MCLQPQVQKLKMLKIKIVLQAAVIFGGIHLFNMPVLTRYKISIQNMHINQQCFLIIVQMVIIDQIGHVSYSRYITVWFPLNTETSGGENRN